MAKLAKLANSANRLSQQLVLIRARNFGFFGDVGEFGGGGGRKNLGGFGGSLACSRPKWCVLLGGL